MVLQSPVKALNPKLEPGTPKPQRPGHLSLGPPGRSPSAVPTGVRFEWGPNIGALLTPEKLNSIYTGEC